MKAFNWLMLNMLYLFQLRMSPLHASIYPTKTFFYYDIGNLENIKRFLLGRFRDDRRKDVLESTGIGQG